MVKLVDKDVGTTGFGLMSLTWRDVPTPYPEAVEIMKTALKSGSVFWNGGEFYGGPERNSLQLLNEYFKKYPEDADKIVISIKGAADPKTIMPQGDEAGIRRSVDNCLKLLEGRKKLDLFECARVDPNVPIEESIAVLASYVKEGKLGGISLSETSANSIRRAAKVHKISAVEVEFSMFATEILENGVAEACRELGIPVVAYSPLGRGFLTGQLKSRDDLPAGDPRLHFPRFQPGNFEKNLELGHKVEEVADKKGCTPGQVALAWVKAHSNAPGMPEIIPIPGTQRKEALIENTSDVTLEAAEFNELNEIVKSCVIVGTRYPEAAMHLANA